MATNILSVIDEIQRREAEALERAAAQAAKLGYGWLRVSPGGGVEFIDAREVQHHEGAPVDGGDGLGHDFDRL